jgi:hypothetical protein
MKSGSNRLLAILFGLPILLVLPIVLLGSSIHRSGVIELSILEKSHDGTSIEVRIPGAIVPVAMHLIPDVTIDGVRREMGPEAREAIGIARTALRSIGQAPDGVFVDVQTPDEIIRVEKRDGKIRVIVDTPDEAVRISVPLPVASSVLAAL